jgi:hypothetical protein
MHFLAHLHAQREVSSPEFAFGLILPDLVAGFTKIYNSILSKVQNEDEIHKGIQHHFNDDKLFHANSVFEQLNHQLTQKLVESGLNRAELRLSVIAHLLVEMLFDRWLVEQHPDLPNRFYNNLEQLNVQSVHLYFNSMNLEHEKNLSLERRQWFLEHRFLYQLHNSEQMTMGVSRIYARLTGRETTKNEQFRIIESVNSFYAQPINWQAILIR